MRKLFYNPKNYVGDVGTCTSVPSPNWFSFTNSPLAKVATTLLCSMALMALPVTSWTQTINTVTFSPNLPLAEGCNVPSDITNITMVPLVAGNGVEYRFALDVTPPVVAVLPAQTPAPAVFNTLVGAPINFIQAG
ncbi:MAG: hypothetical protein ACKVUS_03860, partial [Saprospiraceae bacterium]